MAKKFPAPNYTQTPNLLFDLAPQMDHCELRVVLTIVRETFGWHRDSKFLSLSRLEELTGLSRKSVVKGLQLAVDRGLVTRISHGQSFKYKLSLPNKKSVTHPTKTPSN